MVTGCNSYTVTRQTVNVTICYQLLTVKLYYSLITVCSVTSCQCLQQTHACLSSLMWIFCTYIEGSVRTVNWTNENKLFGSFMYNTNGI